MSTDPGATPPPDELPDPDTLSDEELRAAYEAELARIRVDDVLIQTLVSLLNLGARRAGLAGAAAGEEPDFEQVRLAIEGTRALLPLVEPSLGPDAKQVRDALAQLQLAYARSGAKPPAGAAPPRPAPGAPPAPPKPGDPDSAVSSGRLWVPGQLSPATRADAPAAARLHSARVSRGQGWLAAPSGSVRSLAQQDFWRPFP